MGIKTNKHGTIECEECHHRWPSYSNTINNAHFRHPAGTDVGIREHEAMARFFSSCQNAGKYFLVPEPGNEEWL